MAEGILEPQESPKLNFNQTCVQSPLLHRLWASAVLCCIAGRCLPQLSRSLGVPACSFMCCPKKHPDAVSKHPVQGTGSLPSSALLAPVGCLEPPARGAAAAVGGLGGGQGHEAAGCGREENRGWKRLCLLSALLVNLTWFLSLFPGSLGDRGEAEAAVGICHRHTSLPRLALASW